MTSKTTQLPSVETLITNAFDRFKDRFLQYLLTIAISVGVNLVVAIALLILIGIHVLLYVLTQSVPVVVTVGVITGVLAIVGMFYVSSWIQLTIIQVITAEKKPGVIETFKEMRKHSWDYFLVSLLSFFLVFGIVILGIFGFVIPGIVLGFLWSVWGAFVAYVFLEHKYKGLQNVWASYHIINTHFWGIVGRLLLLGLVIWLIYGIFLAGATQYESLSLFANLLGFVISPFAIAYSYEIYKNLDTNKPDTKSSMAWIIVSVLGWVILLGGILFLSSSISEALPALQEQFEREAILRSTTDI
ncbi:MAG: hypothetical protein ACOCXQ_01700 [Patescibacteria group bacterium]